MKQKIFFIFHTLVVSLLILIAIEGLLRVLVHVKYGRPGKSYGIWEYDPILGADHRSNGYNSLTSTNNYGFRNEEDVFEPNPKNSIRVIAFGGSTTYGHSLKDRETYSYLLQEKLRKISGLEKSQVLNAGRVSYASSQSFEIMKKVIPKLKPDYAIIYEGINEGCNSHYLVKDGYSLDDLLKRQEYGVMGKSFPQHSWVTRDLLIVKLLDRWTKTRKSTSLSSEEVVQNNKEFRVDLEHPWVAKNFETTIRKMLVYLKSQGVRPIVVRYALTKTNYWGNQPLLIDIATKAAKEEGALIYDMKSDFESRPHWKDYFISTGVHVVPEGSEIIAQGLFQVIQEDMRKHSS